MEHADDKKQYDTFIGYVYDVLGVKGIIERGTRL